MLILIGDSDYGQTAVDDSSKGLCGLDNEICSLKDSLMKACEYSERGQSLLKRPEVDLIVADLIRSSAAINKEVMQMFLVGHWQLIYIDDDLTRASPFFSAFSNAFKGDADSIFKITDEIPFKEIGEVRQDVTISGELISKIEVMVTNMPFTSSSRMTTTSLWSTTEANDIIELKVEKTQILDSSLEEVLNKSPLSFLAPSLYPFPTGEVLEIIRTGSSTVYMKLLYIDEDVRICKNVQNEKISIFKRI